MPKPILGYWTTRGLGEPIRLLLHYKGVEFLDKRYAIEDRKEWRNEKFNLGLDFPSLPYYIDGDVKLSQSLAILRYLARKHNLDGRTPEQKLDVLLVEQQLVDFRRNFAFHVHRQDVVSDKEEFLKKVSESLVLFEKFLGEKMFLTGNDVTYVDFYAYEALDYHRLYEAAILDNFSKIKEYHLRVKNLPELQEYLQSATHKFWPLIGPSAKFGGGGEKPKHA